MAGPRFVRPAHVAVVADEASGRPVVYLAGLPDGPIVVLEGSAAVIWAEAANGEGSDVAAAVAQATGADVVEIRAEVERFVADLVLQGLLQRAGPSPEPGQTPA